MSKEDKKQINNEDDLPTIQLDINHPDNTEDDWGEEVPYKENWVVREELEEMLSKVDKKMICILNTLSGLFVDIEIVKKVVDDIYDE